MFFQKKKLETKALGPVSDRRGWYSVIWESFAGAWQQNIEVDRDTVLAYHAVFSCITLIASDISKLKVNLVKESSGIWSPIPFGNYSVLERPNNWQNRIQFFEHWINSKLTRGNTYVLKERDNNGIVRSLYILAPDLVTVLVSDSGDVFYQLNQDNLSGLEQSVVVPASEIIHDRFNCLFHPLVGLSPIYACGLAAIQGIKIQENSALFFKNLSRPSGILTAPGAISDETAARMKESWEANYGGENMGKVAVLGDDLKYQAMSVNAEQSQLIEQLKMSAEVVCATFHVPKYKVIGDPPAYNNIEALEQGYYSQCLQNPIESIELCLDEGLEIPDNQGVQFDLGGLLRMDTATQVNTLGEGIIKAIYTPNEARKKLNLKSVEGGDTPYLQQQNYSLEALSRRDQSADPFGTAKQEQITVQEEPEDEETEEEIKAYAERRFMELLN